MAKVQDTFAIPLELEATFWVCRKAITDIGWELVSLGHYELTAKVGFGLSRSPSRIRVSLAAQDLGTTLVTVAGQMLGIGQTSNLGGLVVRLRNSIEVAAHEAAR